MVHLVGFTVEMGTLYEDMCHFMTVTHFFLDFEIFRTHFLDKMKT